jgi:hypothetical protein
VRHASDEPERGPRPPEPSAERPIAPGGWRRVLIGFLVGLLAGTLVALLLPRDEGPRRRDLRATMPPASKPPASDPVEPPAPR